MTPITRIVFPIIGALIGVSLGSPSTHLFDLLIGAIAGFLIADLGVIRTQLDALSAQVDRHSVDRPKHLGQTCVEQHARMPMRKPDADKINRSRRGP